MNKLLNFFSVTFIALILVGNLANFNLAFADDSQGESGPAPEQTPLIDCGGYTAHNCDTQPASTTESEPISSPEASTNPTPTSSNVQATNTNNSSATPSAILTNPAATN